MTRKRNRLTMFRFADYNTPFVYLFEEMGYEPIILSRETERTLSLGVKHSPETLCLPFKIFLGNYIEALDQGADVLFVFGGRGISKGRRGGACRVGSYYRLHYQILKDLGYEFDTFVFTFGKAMWEKLEESGHSKASADRVVEIFWEMTTTYEYIRDLAYKHRPLALRPAEISRVCSNLVHKLINKRSLEDLADFKQEIKSSYEKLSLDRNREVLKIPLIGEWGLQNMTFINQGVDVLLGELGAETEVTVKLSEFLLHSGTNFAAALNEKVNPNDLHPRIVEKALPYMGHYIGGHGQETVGHLIHSAETGCDGAVHIMPFTCMPEIVARHAVSEVVHDFDFPVLTMVMDEHTGRAGLITRVEAYIDLLKARKEKKEQGNL